MKKLIVLAACTLPLFAFVLQSFKAVRLSKEMPLYEVQLHLGMKPLPFALSKIDAEKVKKGKQLFFEGKADDPKGKCGNLISVYYDCGACHNNVYDGSNSDPLGRLDYTVKNKLPFLQGTTMWGVVNRPGWYAGDYEKKYGDLVKPARKDVREAIQLCAQECSSGRPLEDWELEAFMHYFWSLQVTIGDLFYDEEITQIERAINAGTTGEKEKWLTAINEKDQLNAPATFGYVPGDKNKGYTNAKQNLSAEVGKNIYQNGCLYCHKGERYSEFRLSMDKADFKYLENHMTSEGDLCLYNITRNGTYPTLGNDRYMPMYTKEKLSDNMIESLRYYIEQQAE